MQLDDLRSLAVNKAEETKKALPTGFLEFLMFDCAVAVATLALRRRRYRRTNVQSPVTSFRHGC